MSSLVSVLAKEMDAWPKDQEYFTCDYSGEIRASLDVKYDFYPKTPVDESDRTAECAGLGDDLPRVTKKQWQAERDRQKGGEWKRHRGGKCPVPAGTKVSTRHRNGEVVDVHFHTATTGSGPATMNTIWKHTGDDHDIMQYKVISEPQAEEVEAKRNAAKDADVEYAFGAPGADMSNLDWKPMGKCKVSNIEFDSAEMEEERVKDTTAGTLTYKVEIDTGPAMQALNELSAKWDQVETPFKWRDEVTELNAYIEKYTRERDALINRLAEEGFALLPAMTPVMGVADIDMSDWRNWRSGDIVEVILPNDSRLSVGNRYTVQSIEDPDYIGGMPVSVIDDIGDDHWPEDDKYDGRLVFKFISRP